MKFVNHCFDMNNKEFIIRDDSEAEKYKIKRMRADVARALKPEDTRQVYTKKRKVAKTALNNKARAGSVSPIL